MGDRGYHRCGQTKSAAIAKRALWLIWLASLLALVGEPASAQTADLSIDEIKTETLARAQTGAYPALGIQPADAADALGRHQDA
jgi:hypothetical protein